MGGADVRVRGSAITVLEDLDPDHRRVGGRSGQLAEVAVDEAAGGAGAELSDRGGRDVQAGEVKAADDQRQVVAAVAAADVKAAGQAGLPGGGQDVAGEGHRGSPT